MGTLKPMVHVVGGYSAAVTVPDCSAVIFFENWRHYVILYLYDFEKKFLSGMYDVMNYSYGLF